MPVGAGWRARHQTSMKHGKPWAVFSEMGMALRTELAHDLPLVLGDRVQLQQVILNLIMNGVEAMASVADRPRELFIRSRQHESDKVLVAVQDSGIGIDQQNLEKIFDTFYTTKSQGMGMGLAISRSIVEDHGGRLWAVPNDGPGMTFEFALPVDAVGPTTETVQVVEKQGD